MPTISARRLKRYQAAENVARALRCYFGTPDYKVMERDMAIIRALDWTTYWLEIAGKDRYMLPPKLPARWKRNRDKAMGVPE